MSNIIRGMLISHRTGKAEIIEATEHDLLERLKAECGELTIFDAATRYIGNKAYTIYFDDEFLYHDSYENIPTAYATDYNERLIGSTLILGLPDEEGDCTTLSDGDELNIRRHIGTYPVITNDGGRTQQMVKYACYAPEGC